MKKNDFPDWVLKQQKPSTTIKKIGNNYYLYYASSTYDPINKKPKAIQSYIGKITEDGVISDHLMINPKQCEVYKLHQLIKGIDSQFENLDVLKYKNNYYLLKCNEEIIEKLTKEGIYDDGRIIF